MRENIGSCAFISDEDILEVNKLYESKVNTRLRVDPASKRKNAATVVISEKEKYLFVLFLFVIS